MAKRTAEIGWRQEPEAHDYDAARSYLTLTFETARAGRYVSLLRRSRVTEFKAKDIFRASALSLLGISNAHVEKDRRKVAAVKKLSPLPLMLHPVHRLGILADGHH